MQNLESWHQQLQKVEFGRILEELIKYFHGLPDSWIKFEGFMNVLSIYARKSKLIRMTLQLELKQLLSKIAIQSVNCPNLILLIFEIFSVTSDIGMIFSKDMQSFWSILLIEHDFTDVREVSRSAVIEYMSKIEQ